MRESDVIAIRQNKNENRKKERDTTKTAEIINWGTVADQQFEISRDLRFYISSSEDFEVSKNRRTGWLLEIFYYVLPLQTQLFHWYDSS